MEYTKLKIEWDYVTCPSTGSNRIQYCLKEGSSGHWAAIQPTHMSAGVDSVLINDRPTTMVASSYYFLLTTETDQLPLPDISNLKITMTSIAGEVIEDVVSFANAKCVEVDSQFTASGSIQTEPETTSVSSTKNAPTEASTDAPTDAPTEAPTEAPTTAPPTDAPTSIPQQNLRRVLLLQKLRHQLLRRKSRRVLFRQSLWRLLLRLKLQLCRAIIPQMPKRVLLQRILPRVRIRPRWQRKHLQAKLWRALFQQEPGRVLFKRALQRQNPRQVSIRLVWYRRMPRRVLLKRALQRHHRQVSIMQGWYRRIPRWVLFT